MRVVRTHHFRREQEADGITDDEIAHTWTQPEIDRASKDHPGARVRTATQADGSRVTVVARHNDDELVLITTWRSDDED
jgi:hypothetical protein